MRNRKQYKIGDIKRWQGIKNSDTKQFESGYLWIVTKIDEQGNILQAQGISIQAKNRNEAIKKYLDNPKNPNNYKYENRKYL